MMFSRSNLNSSIFNDADSWRHDRKLLNFDIQFPGIFAHVTPLLRQPAKVENPFENDFSGMFRNVFSKKWCAALSSVVCPGEPFGPKIQFNANVFLHSVLEVFIEQINLTRSALLRSSRVILRGWCICPFLQV